MTEGLLELKVYGKSRILILRIYLLGYARAASASPASLASPHCPGPLLPSATTSLQVITAPALTPMSLVPFPHCCQRGSFKQVAAWRQPWKVSKKLITQFTLK